MKFETFQAGVWPPRYQYRSFEPVPVWISRGVGRNKIYVFEAYPGLFIK